MDQKCRVCKVTLADDAKPESKETGVCMDCRKRLGIVPMGEPMRKPHGCMRCARMRFTRLLPTGISRALEMYICHGCGFVEWYCRDVAGIPIGPEHMSELIDYGPAPGYR
jgi:hypothetical protein